MRIVFIGAVQFSFHSMKKLLELQANIVGVCTLQESKSNADHVDLSDLANSHGIPCHYADDINSRDSINWIIRQKPDVIFCFGWSRLLKRELLTLTSKGVVGFHPAALPANRGRHPLIWALALGLDNTASTFFFIGEKADDGDIISQEEIIISNDDDAKSLYAKMTKVALKQIELFFHQLIDGKCSRTKQDELSSNNWRKRSKEDGVIDWRMSANSIHNLVRALGFPYVGASFVCGEKEVKIWETVIVKNVPNNIEPGKIIAKTENGPLVMCGEGAICIITSDLASELNVGEYL